MFERFDNYCIVRNVSQVKKTMLTRFECETGKVIPNEGKTALMSLNHVQLFRTLAEWMGE
ncbi:MULTISPECIES: hypothetical protein [unclassified Lactococcus]|uniref:hypothetical protein n=1 Tax=unclassified Lactococcus TaxID=2643510 RepID=UPI0011CB1994|nr:MULTISPECIES: hypothetical protein [unclassified Lactococcus]MQW21982.1 hypothetical protein [Lactococcus sp. dk101]TXK36837.1 hypothetical protein FVP42_10700 [Lactococcus sp. dk310]TXK47465.1 hypothetical protein FVP43_10140 [Lactococcus sp. dk322]